MRFKSLPKIFGMAAVGTMIAVTGIVANSSAAAAASYDDSIPGKATDVRTFHEYTAASGAKLQLRMGKYNGVWYRWARAYKPDRNLNEDYTLRFKRSGTGTGCGTAAGVDVVDIDGTTYTGAVRVTTSQAPYCWYEASWGKKDAPFTWTKRIQWNGR